MDVYIAINDDNFSIEGWIAEHCVQFLFLEFAAGIKNNKPYFCFTRHQLCVCDIHTALYVLPGSSVGTLPVVLVVRISI